MWNGLLVSSSVSLPEILAMSTHSLLNGFPHCNKHSENNREIVWEIIVVIVFVQNVQDLESHVVSIRDCLQCLFNRFHTSASTDCPWTNKFSVLIVSLSVISGFQLRWYYIVLSLMLLVILTLELSAYHIEVTYLSWKAHKIKGLCSLTFIICSFQLV